MLTGSFVVGQAFSHLIDEVCCKGPGYFCGEVVLFACDNVAEHFGEWNYF